MLSIAPLFSSSSGNATYIGTEKTGLLVDAGLPGGVVENALGEIDHNPPRAILVTHEHVDHIRGVGVLSRRWDVPVYANAATWESMEPKLGKIDPKNIRVFQKDEFFVGDVCVQPIPISHDAAGPVGFAFYGGGKKVCTITDTGRITQEILEAAKNASIVLLESNHDVEMLKCGRYPYALKMRILSGSGHLSNEDAGKAAVQLARRGVRGILLGHLSKENNHEAIALQTVRDTLEAYGIRVGKDIALGVTKKSAVTGLFKV